MSKYFVTFANTFVVMVAVDIIWLGVVVKSFYQKGIGHLMAVKPVVSVAAAFYIMYAIGLVFFAAVATKSASGSAKTALKRFG